jgi:hypothetical protein
MRVLSAQKGGIEKRDVSIHDDLIEIFSKMVD